LSGVKDRIALMAAALWWGSLGTIGFLVVPMLFVHLDSSAVAGNFAGRLFAAQSWVALACGLLLLVHLRAKAQDRQDRIDEPSRTALSLVLAALLLALLQEYAVAPRVLARDNLKLWHAVGSAMYFGQWICTGALLWRMGRRTG
jgi:hypothetical protein